MLLLATFLNYMDRQALAVTLPELKRAYNLQEKRIGLIEGCFGFAFAAGSIVFGLLADRVGPRGLYPVVLTGWSLAGVATAFAGDPRAVSWLEGAGDDPGTGVFRWLLFWRTVLGVFEAGHWPCALITARQVLSRKDRTLGNGILQSGGAVASICIPLYAELIERVGGNWQVTFWSIGVVGLLWVPLWLLLVPRGSLTVSVEPPDRGGAVATEPADRTGVFRRAFVLGLIVCTITVSWQFLRAWLTLLLDFHEYSRLDARLATTGYFVSAEIGCLLVGFVVMVLVRGGRSVRAARVIAFAGYAGLTAVAALVPFVGSGALMLTGLMVAGAGILGLHPLYYALSQELPHRHMGVLSGALAAGGWVVSSVFQILIGAQIQATKSYDVGLAIAGLAPVIGLVALLVLWKAPRPAGAAHTVT
ncbi:D-galactonate transporter [Gemmata obscuriglobus]|uniref:MFS transporter n=1 Tax=Gemmata obscuriglobus TaxID=114 RepID=A0A2Z3HAB3_9BACT|nr:MFS transporter [Gemmata obscuriglobus]AWM41382.1 MFS transporter [Gemmata obscuriglobus]QEG32724.1 D-galactonate transporter [Gemmata obscuriglobus]VTS12082.1 major facilitator superfamily mfs_1 : Major facilitator superfamily MFS_1 OS=Chthoniobacter flavus Ellin428 GN=CfE428DRAFT_2805 PE=4 SV=1: MFS_1 [Gemmata obscuriglobus UQM 2246]